MKKITLMLAATLIMTFISCGGAGGGDGGVDDNSNYEETSSQSTSSQGASSQSTSSQGASSQRSVDPSPAGLMGKTYHMTTTWGTSKNCSFTASKYGVDIRMTMEEVWFELRYIGDGYYEAIHCYQYGALPSRGHSYGTGRDYTYEYKFHVTFSSDGKICVKKTKYTTYDDDGSVSESTETYVSE